MECQISLFDVMREPERTVELIPRERAKAFVEKIHYSRKLPSNVVKSFGLYEDGDLVGVVTYGIPASPPPVSWLGR